MTRVLAALAALWLLSASPWLAERARRRALGDAPARRPSPPNWSRAAPTSRAPATAWAATPRAAARPTPAAAASPRPSAPSTRRTSRPTRRPASARGPPPTSGARCTTAARATGGCCTRPFRTELHADHARRCRRAVRLPAQPAAGRAGRTGRTSCVPVRPASGAGACGARCTSGPDRTDRAACAARVEPRRLPGRGPRPLQRLPRERNALGATRDPLDLAGGLIPMQNWYAPSLTRRTKRAWRWTVGSPPICCRPASRRAARSRADGRGGAAQHPAPEHRRPAGDGAST